MTALGATTEAQEPEKPLTGYPADRDALNQAYCVSSAKRNAQEVHDAFLKGVEWEKRRACNSFDALTEANARMREALERADQLLSGIQHYSTCKTARDEAADIRGGVIAPALSAALKVTP